MRIGEAYPLSFSTDTSDTFDVLPHVKGSIQCSSTPAGTLSFEVSNDLKNWFLVRGDDAGTASTAITVSSTGLVLPIPIRVFSSSQCRIKSSASESITITASVSD